MVLILVVIALTGVIYLIFAGLLGMAAWSARAKGKFRLTPGGRTLLKKADPSWAIDIEPEEATLLVRIRDRGGDMQELRAKRNWLREDVWSEGVTRADAERDILLRLDKAALKNWRPLRALGWQVIRLIEESERREAVGPAFASSTNRAGLLRMLESALVGLEYLSVHRGSPPLLREIEQTILAMKSRQNRGKASAGTGAFDATLRAHEERLAHQQRIVAILPEVQADLDCLEANLRLTAEQFTSALATLRPEQPGIFRAADAALINLELPILARIRQGDVPLARPLEAS